MGLGAKDDNIPEFLVNLRLVRLLDSKAKVKKNMIKNVKTNN